MTASIERIARSDAWRTDFIRRNGFRCHYCNRSGGIDIGPDDRAWHVDHKDPLSRGGEDVEENLALACQRCNAVKHAQSYSRFSEFARLAYWVPDDWRLSEADLDSLMSSYAGWGDKFNKYETSDREWKADARTNAVCIFDVDQRFVPLLELGEHFRYDKHSEVIQLVVDMYRALPPLIAEIRMHRAAEQHEVHLEVVASEGAA